MSLALAPSSIAHAQAVVSEMVAGIERARDLHHTLTSDTDQVELELRLGIINSDSATGFTAGVTAAAFARVEKRLDTGRDWARVEEWSNSRCFFHKRTSDDARVRTEATVLHNSEHQVHSQIKNRIGRYDWLINPGLSGPWLAIRLDINHEQQLRPSDDLTASVLPHAVHLKQRKSYYYCPTGQTAPVWCYSLTKRWIGATLEDVMSAKASSEPAYEIELECTDPTYLMTTETASVAYKTLSKIGDLLGLIDPKLSKTPYAVLPVNKCKRTGRHNPSCQM
jgi:hypothetical protein